MQRQYSAAVYGWGQLCRCPQIQTVPLCLLGSFRLADRDGEPVHEQKQRAQLPGAPQYPALSIQPDQVSRSAPFCAFPHLFRKQGRNCCFPETKSISSTSFKIWTSAAEYVKLTKGQVCHQERRKSSGW